MQITTIGLDLAKNVFQVHGIDAGEKVVARKQLKRSQMMAYFKALPPCLVGMEACATAHYWARELAKLGHEVRLMPTKDVKVSTPSNEMGWINGGFFVLEPKVMDYIDGGSTIWERQPLENLAAQGHLGAYRHEGFWKAMDTLRDRRELEELWASGKAPWKRW